MNKNTQYIIAYKETAKTTKYVRKILENGKNSGVGWWRHPVITPKPYLIDAGLIFETIEDTEAFIKEMLKAEHLNYLRTKKNYENGRKYYYETTWLRKCKQRADKTRYSVEEYVADFVCETKKQTIKSVWMDDGTAKMFCTACGTNLHYGKYVLIRKAKICPFCLKGMGDHAKSVIKELKKKDKEIEEDYNCSMFVAHMD
jgi:hypothetical protein